MADARPVVGRRGHRWRYPSGNYLYVGNHGHIKGRGADAQQFRGERGESAGCWQISESDRFLLALPLFHVHGLGNGLHCWLASGCRMRLLERFEHQSAAADVSEISDRRCFSACRPCMSRLLDLEPDTAREIGAFMRLFVSGSAPLPAQVLEEFRDLYGHTILERYGMSETLMNMSNPYAGERRPGTVGFPLPGVSVRLLESCAGPGRRWRDGGEFICAGRIYSRVTGGARKRLP